MLGFIVLSNNFAYLYCFTTLSIVIFVCLYSSFQIDWHDNGSAIKENPRCSYLDDYPRSHRWTMFILVTYDIQTDGNVMPKHTSTSLNYNYYLIVVPISLSTTVVFK